MNKITKKEGIEGMGFILMIVGMLLGMLCIVYDIKELKELVNGASNFRSIN
jgi:hypothetical protein